VKSLLHKIESLWRKPFDPLLIKYRAGMLLTGIVISVIFLFGESIGNLVQALLRVTFTSAGFVIDKSSVDVVDHIGSVHFYIPVIIIIGICYIVGNAAGWSALAGSSEVFASSKKGAFIERLLSVSPVGAIMTDAEGVVTYTNSEAHQIFSSNDHGSALGQNVHSLDLVANTVLSETVVQMEKAFTGVFRQEVAFKKDPASDIEWFDCFFSPVNLDSARLGSIGWIYDRTQEHRKQEDVINSIILALTKAIDAKDKGTHAHSMRVRKIALTLAGHLSLPPARYPALEYSALLHDVGKILLPDDIIKGITKLTDEQKEIIARLPEYSASFLEGIDDLAEVRDIVFYQREWYVPPKDEGSTFKPFPGIKTGDAIPIEARIIAVADAFEGMTTEKGYRKAMPKDIALIEFKRSSGIKPTEDEVNRLLYHYKQTRSESMGLDELLSHSRVERQFDYKIVRALETAITNGQV